MAFSIVDASVFLAIMALAFFEVWRKKLKLAAVDNLPGPVSEGFFMGNLAQLYAPNSWKFHQELRASYFPVLTLHGMLGVRTLFWATAWFSVRDCCLSSASFLGPFLIFRFDVLPIATGDHHKMQRKMMTPVFSTENLRLMLPVIYEVAQELKGILAEHTLRGNYEIDILKWMNRAALEIIGHAGLGYSFDSLKAAPASSYGDAVTNLISVFLSLLSFGYGRPLVGVLELGPAKLCRLLVRMVPWPKLQRLCKMVDIMDETTLEVYNAKKIALQDDSIFQYVGKGRDIMTILLRANMKASLADRLPEEDVLGQMSTLIFAATDTTSGALSHVLHLLAQNLDVQNTLRKEILAANERSGGRLPYEELMSLPYLDSVCRETLRLFPPLTSTTRTTSRDTVLPLSSPILGKDGTLMSDVFIPRNTNVVIGIMASNRNTAIWGPDAGTWNPGRWSHLPDTVLHGNLPGVYSHMLTFLGGGKGCIGFKFSEMEIKAVLSILLSTFHFSLGDAGITWYLSGVQKPRVDGAIDYSLPLKVTAI
ncbi:cytochrome P450 [Mycena haematopus]|nr:cytochrome P450 [Mycena haematopus]